MKIVFIAFFMLAANFSIYFSSKSEAKLSSLALENIQALAYLETGGKYITIRASYIENASTTVDGPYVTTCIPYKITCMSGGNENCYPGSGKDCSTIKIE